jgi:hypothetical protein
VLLQRHIEKQGNFLECGAKEDTIYHALIECPYANAFWTTFKSLYNIKLPKLHPLTWAQDLLDTSICKEEKACYILCGMWSVLSAPNGRLHGNSHVKITQACRWVHDTVADLLASSKPYSRFKTQIKTHWQRPQEGFLKVNVDAGYNANSMEGKSGGVTRDNNGICL